ncbi:Rieske 2Fe-2S domain-containing protein [Niveispirillum sp. SYP-B3756]|uniref:aromatic ring-hydroxylating oxygenase subunit alpha n=1 Tax=Niveispirillum sp. SYP-B3756 TaxID=2662178 RepID=UPI0012921133|nr:aromatic ring-hydroxylating dioxygenase subunit alpha [Niveispirillum sp. SYP-B3756]MQP68610.1 Rieske 2Fe-2S domain-containing protein [Niveispirillum sp. SYP-B3756]
MIEYEEALKGAYGFATPKAVKGTSSVGLRTYADILVGDGQPVPPVLQRSDMPVKVEGLISYDRYIDPAFVALETEHIWKKQWQVACREEDLPNVGDRLPYDIASLSFIIVRSGPDEFRAFYNSCPHRGRRLCDHAESAGEIRCPFHAWTWGLDGSLAWVPGGHDFPHVSDQHHRLQEVQLGRWGGNIFINPDPEAPPLEQALGVMVSQFKDHPLEERYTVLHLRKKVRCNWKLTQEAFMEGYHVLETHWDGMPFFGSAFTQYDAWDDGVCHVSRLVTPSVVPDVWVQDKVSPHESARQFCATFGLREPAPGEVTTVAEARAYCADQRRRKIEAETGLDLGAKPVSYFLDMTKCFVFPNHHPWWGEALPWWYRFMPVGDDPGMSMMEVRITAPVPKGAPRPATATPIDLGPDDRTSECEALGVVGYILDQDMSNLVEIQKGLKAAKPGKDFMTLARYQESNIQHFHNVYNRLLGLSR